MLLFDKIAEVFKIIFKLMNEKNFLLHEYSKDDIYHCEFEKVEDKIE